MNGKISNVPDDIIGLSEEFGNYKSLTIEDVKGARK